MLKKISIANFKPIASCPELNLKPITVLAGLNSSGKSTVLQSILLLSQTLSNQSPEKTLVLNGHIIQLGTFDAVHNIQDKSETIEIGFTLTPTKSAQPYAYRQRPRTSRRFSGLEDSLKDISIETTFKPAAPRSMDKPAIEAVRVALQKCTVTAEFDRTEEPPSPDELFFPIPPQEEPADKNLSVTASINSLTQVDQANFLQDVSEEFSTLIPYPGGQNFLATISSNKSQPKTTLAHLSHFLPERLVGKFSLQHRQASELSQTIELLADRSDVLYYLPPSRRTFFDQIAKYQITDKIREKVNSLNQSKNAVAFAGKNASDLLGWAKRVPLKTRAKFNFIRSIKEVLMTEITADLYKQNSSKQEYGLEGIVDDITASAVELATRRTINHFSTMIRYLGPLRADPQAAQGFAPSNEPDDVGFKGEYAAAVYDANKRQPIIWWHPDTREILSDTLEHALNTWAKYIGVAQRVSTQDAGPSGVAWSVQSLPNAPERPLQAVGVGVSQVLPILVAGLLAPTGATILIEQPELHLHARAQARLGDFFLGLARANKQCIVETHSDCLVNQLRLAMVKGGSDVRSLIGIYFAEQDSEGSSTFSPVEISPSGNIINWPDGFFDESIQQEERITQESYLAKQRNSQTT
ncbi:hypothetical protein EJ065_3802 [Corallococcus coralloides]|uniref:AAA domain-containing protein n=1 Tax=Corallococcus coralloides TaxID=184914 RepID=A0A410RTU5_CORCK|nr:DUF3696 domain-containing protein [Corallococcus coralloides]QAT85363.1 hypothetical protein EJ065_3802 [Corallococcus coralloides]